MKNLQIKKLVIPFLFILSILSIFVIYKYKQNERSDIFIPVLMYHNLDEDPDFKKITYTIKPNRFEQHMMAIKKSGYNPITATELNKYVYDNKDLPKKPILITFDDGKTNNYDYAYPILKILDMKGTLFTIVHTSEEHNNPDYLNWSQLKEMYNSGVMDIQSHTYDLHHKLDDSPLIFQGINKESDSEYKERILSDLHISKELIEKNIGNKVVSLAYPYGEYNEYIEDIAKEAGYKQTYTTNIGTMKKSDSPYSIKRINVDGLCSDKRLLFEITLFKILSSIF